MKRPSILLLVAFCCLALAYSWSFWGTQRQPVAVFERHLPDYLSEQSVYLEQLLADSVFLNYFLERDALRYLTEVEGVVQQLADLEARGLGLCLLKDGELLLSATGADWQPPDALSALPVADFSYAVGTQLWWVQVRSPAPGVRALLFLSVHQAPYADYLRFLAQTATVGRPVEIDGQEVFRVLPVGALPRALLHLGLYLLGGLAIWRYGHLQVLRYRGAVGLRSAVWALMTAVLLLWWLQSSIWPDTWLFLQPLWETPWLPATLWGLVGQVAVVLWLFRHFYELFHGLSVGRVVGRWLLVPLLYFLGLSSLLGVAFWLKMVIVESTVFFNLDQVLQVSWSGLWVALGLILWLMAIFLLVKRLSSVVHAWSVPMHHRLSGMLVGIVMSYGVLLLLGLGVSIWVWTLLAFIFLVLIDLQLDSGPFTLTWLMIWLILLSTFSASFTYKFSLEKELGLMKEQRALLWSALAEGRADEVRTYQHPRYKLLRIEPGSLYEGDGYFAALDWEAIRSLEPGEDYGRITNQMIQVAGRWGDELIILQKELGSYFRPLSLFALYFSLFLVLILGFVLLHARLPLLPDFLLPVFRTRNSLRNRIQLAVIGIILVSSVIIAGVTIWYFQDTAIRSQERQVLRQLGLISQELNDQPVEVGRLGEIADKTGIVFALYDTQGERLYPDGWSGELPYWMPASTLEQLRLALFPYRMVAAGDSQRRLAFAPVKAANGQIRAYMGLSFSRYSATRGQEINDFVGSVFSLYVFFMFIAGGVAIWVANSITEPISKIGEGLRNLQLGANVPLAWKNHDEIGLLVQEYNTAVAKLEDSTRQLRKAEREGAWRDMAQQVAHEIKNPLTPMKLSVQHLLRAYQSDPEAIGPLLRRMSATLIEQIEGLARIANEFSHFARMPEAQLERLNLNELLSSAVDLHQHRVKDTQLELNLPVEAYFVEVDRDQLLRVFNNLLTNAAQAIPDDRQGLIQLSLKPVGQQLQIRISDNGRGIPPDLQDKVFYPYFTTKSSGTGIGLSMCRNIIEQFGGRIYFEHNTGQGTSFIIELNRG